MDIATALRPGTESDPVKRLVTVAIGVAAVLAALLAIVAVHSAKAQERAETQASRLLALMHERDAPMQSWSALDFLATSELLILKDSIDQGLAFPDAASKAVAAADVRAFIGLSEVRETIRLTPTNERLPQYAREALDWSRRETSALAKALGRREQVSDAYLQRSDSAALALFLVAVATALLGLAGVTSAAAPARVAAGAAIAALAVSAAIGVRAVLS